MPRKAIDGPTWCACTAPPARPPTQFHRPVNSNGCRGTPASYGARPSRPSGASLPAPTSPCLSAKPSANVRHHSNAGCAASGRDGKTQWRQSARGFTRPPSSSCSPSTLSGKVMPSVELRTTINANKQQSGGVQSCSSMSRRHRGAASVPVPMTHRRRTHRARPSRTHCEQRLTEREHRPPSRERSRTGS